MKIELSEEQAQALARWALQPHLEHGVSGWGKAFDDAMAVAENVREQLERNETVEKLINSFHFSVSWCDTARAYVGRCDEKESLSWGADSLVEALEGIIDHTRAILKQEWPLRKSLSYFREK